MNKLWKNWKKPHDKRVLETRIPAKPAKILKIDQSVKPAVKTVPPQVSE